MSEASLAYWSQARSGILASPQSGGWPTAKDLYGFRRHECYVHPLGPQDRLPGLDQHLIDTLRNADICVARFSDVHVAGTFLPVILKQPASQPIMPYTHDSRVGCVLLGRIFPTVQIPALLDFIIRQRNNTEREIRVKQSLYRLSDQEMFQLDTRCNRWHRRAVLLGILAGINPPEVNYRIALQFGRAQIGSLTIALREQTARHTVAYLPVYYEYVNTHPILGASPRVTTKLEAVRKLFAALLSALGPRISCSEEKFQMAHIWEEDIYRVPIIRFLNEDKPVVYALIARHLDCLNKRPTYSRPSH